MKDNIRGDNYDNLRYYLIFSSRNFLLGSDDQGDSDESGSRWCTSGSQYSVFDDLRQNSVTAHPVCAARRVHTVDLGF